MRMEAGRQREPRPTGDEERPAISSIVIIWIAATRQGCPPARFARPCQGLAAIRAQCTKRRKWQGFGLAYGRWNTRPVGAGHCAANRLTHKFTLDTIGL